MNQSQNFTILIENSSIKFIKIEFWVKYGEEKYTKERSKSSNEG